tara:strand:- start:1053 stop:1259 length:207 start_codon:yes stop_codon:yes gene_type:complete
MKSNLDLYPTREATAPSNEPCGNPIKKIRKKEIIFIVVNSVIFYLNIALINANLGILLIILIFVKIDE